MRKKLRDKVLKRDRGICVDCGIDCVALQARIDALREQGATRSFVRESFKPHGLDTDRTLWEADHEIPIDEGGKDSLSNIQTRCQACHKIKTRDQKQRARRLPKKIRKNVGRR